MVPLLWIAQSLYDRKNSVGSRKWESLFTMTIELVLSIASFALSIGGLVPVLLLKERKKQVILAIILSALIPTSGITFYALYQHESMINRVEKEIASRLAHHTWTFDQIYNELHYAPYPIVSEALFRAVEGGMIGHRVIEFRSEEGTLQVKGYFLQSRAAGQ